MMSMMKGRSERRLERGDLLFEGGLRERRLKFCLHD